MPDPVAPFHGVIPYLPTPLTPAGEVDADALARVVDRLIAAGVHGLTPLGSTGEFAYLSADQKRAAVAATVAAAAGRVPVVAVVAATATALAVEEARAWEGLGADGILAVMEAYFPVPESGVVDYFAAVAEATALPCVLYTNLNFQRSDLSLGALDRLADHPRVVGVKDASTNTGRLLSILDRCAGRLDVFAASAHVTAAVMLIGGRGWMAGPSCLVPEASVALYARCRAGDWTAAMALQRELWAVNEVFAKWKLAAAVKAGLRLQGLEVGDPIPPQAPVPPEGIEEIRRALRRVDALPEPA